MTIKLFLLCIVLTALLGQSTLGSPVPGRHSPDYPFSHYPPKTDDGASRDLNPYSHYAEIMYVLTYRNSDSRYRDLLAGLALYNMRRTDAHRVFSPNVHSSGAAKFNIENRCNLRVEETGKVSRLRIPCKIVSTFIPANKGTTNGTVNCSEAAVNGQTLNCFAVSMSVNPRSVKGPKLQVTAETKCAVEARMQQLLTTRQVDCSVLMNWSTKKAPKLVFQAAYIKPTGYGLVMNKLTRL